MGIDGTVLDVPDTPENDAELGRPGTGRGEGSAFPQLRLVGLGECGTHALVGVAMGPCTTGETTLTRQLLGSFRPGMLVLADRNFFSFELWEEARATGADLLWRTKSNHSLPVDQRLADGSYLSHAAPRGALSYPLLSREGPEEMSLGLMAYPDSKVKGDNSMPENRPSCPGVRGDGLGARVIWRTAILPKAQSPVGATGRPPERRL
jgi:hypothetical protein